MDLTHEIVSAQSNSLKGQQHKQSLSSFFMDTVTMFVPREVIRDNNTQEFTTRYSINDYTIKLNRCYNSGLILQKIDNHIFTFFLIKPHVTHGSIGVNICGDKWKAARRTSRN